MRFAIWTVGLVSFLLFSTSLQAGIKDLSVKLVEGNMVVAQSRVDEVKSYSALEKFKSSYDWNLFSNLKYQNSYLSQLFSFMVQQTKSNTFDYGLSKKLTFGAEFSVTQRFVFYDLSNWTGPNAALLPSQRPYEVQHIITYKQELLQDWLGKGYKYDLVAQDQSVKLAKLNLDFQTEGQMFAMANAYLNGKYNQTLLELNKESLKRAQKRELLVRQRVRDGLSLSVELLQAEMAKIKQEELIQQSEQKVVQILDDLNEHLNIEIKTSDVSHYDLKKYPKKVSYQGLESNLELQQVEQNILITRAALEKAKLALLPSLSLKFSQTNNAIVAQFGDALNNSYPGKRNVLQTVELNFALPLGFRAAEAEVESKRADVQLQSYKMDQTKRRLQNSLKNLEQEAAILDRNMHFVQKRLELAEKALQEQNRLYSLGKIDLEVVIRAEEDLINTQMAAAGYRMSWEIIQASLAKISGKFPQFVDEYLE